MKNKLISDIDLPQFCKFCEMSIPLIDDSYMLCRKYGTVEITHKCRKFSYDPLKHIPSMPVRLIKPDDEELIF